MFVDLTPEQHALRHKVRDYFQALMTPDMREQLRGCLLYTSDAADE